MKERMPQLSKFQGAICESPVVPKIDELPESAVSLNLRTKVPVKGLMVRILSSNQSSMAFRVCGPSFYG